MDKKLNEKFTKLLDKIMYTDKELTQNITLLAKDQERLKYDLNEMIDSKFESIQRNLENQTRGLR